MTNEITQNEINKSHIKPPGEVQYYIETSRDYWLAVPTQVLALWLSFCHSFLHSFIHSFCPNVFKRLHRVEEEVYQNRIEKRFATDFVLASYFTLNSYNFKRIPPTAAKLSDLFKNMVFYCSVVFITK